MINDEEYLTWLAGLKVGDTVMVDVSIGWQKSIRTPYKIDRMTPKQAVIQVRENHDIRFRLDDGSILGQKFGKVSCPTPESLKAYKDHKTKSRFIRAIEVLNGCSADISIEVMEELVDRLYAEAEKAEANREKRIAHEREMKAKRGY